MAGTNDVDDVDVVLDDQAVEVGVNKGETGAGTKVACEKENGS